MKNQWLDQVKDVEVWERDLTYWEEKNKILEEESAEWIKDQVLDWLKDDQGDAVLTLEVGGSQGFISFTRSEINIKVCKNVWEVWRIATSCHFNQIISYRIKEIGANELPHGFSLPNEIRSENYAAK